MPETSPLRVLVVDDDALITKVLSQLLEIEGYSVATANSGQAGIETFQSAIAGNAPFSVVITDLGMSEVDGRQVAMTVKSASPCTPVILLTGWGQWFDTPTGVPVPVDCVLAKPVKFEELKEALGRCLKLNHC